MNKIIRGTLKITSSIIGLFFMTIALLIFVVSVQDKSITYLGLFLFLGFNILGGALTYPLTRKIDEFILFIQREVSD